MLFEQSQCDIECYLSQKRPAKSKNQEIGKSGRNHLEIGQPAKKRKLSHTDSIFEMEVVYPSQKVCETRSNPEIDVSHHKVVESKCSTIAKSLRENGQCVERTINQKGTLKLFLQPQEITFKIRQIFLI